MKKSAFSLWIALTSLALLTASSRAAQVIWGSSRTASNFASTGAPLSSLDPFTFQIGSFQPGFTPTANNTSEWLKHWVPAQSTFYNPSTQFFSSSYHYTENKAPFLPTNQAYIWGFDRQAQGQGVTQGEWVLLTNSTWKWPQGSGDLVSFPYQWTVAGASTAVVGKINDPQKRFHIQTQRVTLPSAAGFAETWRNRYFPSASAAQRDWAADPDRDGLENALELALGRDPTKPDVGASAKLEVASDSRGTYQRIAIERSGLIPGVALRAEVSEDLRTWTTLPSDAIVEDSAEAFRARDILPLAAKRTRFLRLTVVW